MTPADFRAARASLGLTQKSLAKALRMGTHGWQTISRWESDDFTGTIPGPVQVAMEHLINCPVAPKSRTITGPAGEIATKRMKGKHNVG
ncbi:MAG: hypothetical protein EBR45_13200 [Betaproteobacteria bacterium]|nr:hypothetical protein [Betaproteobacteria bacterium]